MENLLPVPQRKVSKEEAELRVLIYAVKAKAQELFGNSAKAEITISNVPSFKLREMKEANYKLTGEYGKAVTIDTTAGKVSLMDDSMPF